MNVITHVAVDARHARSDRQMEMKCKQRMEKTDQIGRSNWLSTWCGNLSGSISEGVVNLLLTWPWIDILKNDLVEDVCGMGV